MQNVYNFRAKQSCVGNMRAIFFVGIMSHNSQENYFNSR